MTGEVIWCGIVPIFRTDAYESKLPPPGNKAASPNSMAHREFFKGWPPLVLAGQNFPAAFAILGHAGTPCLVAGACSKTQNGGSARKILYNTSPYNAVISGANREWKNKMSTA